jgi:hypothetical protein
VSADPPTPPLTDPPTIWMGTTAFRKEGTPVLGNMGRTARRVVIIDAPTWNRLMREHPTLATAHFRVGELDG